MSVLDQLSTSERDSMIYAAVRGDYHLLLGAGASVDSRDSDGETLPLTAGLTTRFKDAYHLSSPLDLSLAYERACKKTSEFEVHIKLKKWFTQCQPADWYRSLIEVTWRRIWTLNVDDVVEQSYVKWNDQAFQSPSSLNWDQPFNETSALQIVHLHGYLGSPSARIVFSLNEYLNAREEGHAWHRAFGELWSEQPFIVLGARLVSEYDLGKVFRAKRATALAPSVYVAKDIDADTKDDLRDWGVIPIQAPASAFMAELAEAVRPHRSLAARVWTRAAVPSHRLAEFSADFRLLSDGEEPPVQREHDFIQGDPPTWSDILHARDALLPWEEQLSDRISASYSTPPCVAVHLLLPERFSGISTGLLRVAKLQTDSGHDVFIFRAERRFNVGATLDYLAASPGTLLIFDAVADFADDVSSLARRARENGIVCQVLATERDSRRAKVVAQLTDTSVIEYDSGPTGLGVSPMGREAAKRVVDHLERIGRTGRLNDVSIGSRIGRFQRLGIFMAMAEVELGRGFRDRISGELGRIAVDSHLKLVFLTSVLDSIGYELPVSLAGSVGMTAKDVIAAVQENEQLKTLLVVSDRGTVRTRVRTLALDVAQRTLGDKKAAGAMKELAIELKPSVNERTIKSRTLPSRIVGGVMRARALEHWIGAGNLLDFFESLEGTYGGNPRFWEQRAIACQIVGNWAAADSFARTAVRLAPDDSHRLNTLGAILLRRAWSDFTAGTKESWAMYDEAVKELDEAMRVDYSNPVPIATYLDGTLMLLERLHLAGMPVDGLPVVSEFQAKLVDATCHDGFRQSKEVERLADIQRRFLLAVLTGSSAAVADEG